MPPGDRDADLAAGQARDRCSRTKDGPGTLGPVLRFIACAAMALVCASPAAADDWWPHPSDATWVYAWSDSVYAKTPTKEKVTVKSDNGSSFELQWTTEGLDNQAGYIPSAGTMPFNDTNFGVANASWSSNAPPGSFPVLCAQAASCPNALSDTLYYMIWGSRDPVLAQPLAPGLTWTSAGGAQYDVSGSSVYEGREIVKVPAFPNGVLAAKVRTDVVQAGAKGDPYGSGVRTIWWVFGIGPVKILFQHAGGSDAPVTTSELQSTSLQPKTAPADVNWFPMRKGDVQRFSWTNTKYLKTPSVQQFTVDAVANETARFSAKHVSGPIKVASVYVFSMRLDGLTNLTGNTSAATRLRFPALGPSSLPADRRRHFFTPFDLMDFGWNPVLPAYAAAGSTWGAKNPSRDYSVYGATGASRVLAPQRVVTPAGTFTALVVASSLRQPGFPFGSGTRTAWFAPGVGLVKLVFRHGDGSVSTVVRVK
jgi:hypothetical protein